MASANQGADGKYVLVDGDNGDRSYGHQVETNELHGGSGNDYVYMDDNDSIDGGIGTDCVFMFGEEDFSINMDRANIEQVYLQSDANLNLDTSSTQQDLYLRACGCGGNDDSNHGHQGITQKISSGDGSDCIYIGENDKVDGGAGNDYLYRQDGNDSFDGGEGNDCIHGGNSNDNPSGGEGSDRLCDESGNDTFTLDEGSAIVYGGEGACGFLRKIEVNGKSIEFTIEDGGITVGANAAGMISFADGTEVAFAGVEQIQW